MNYAIIENAFEEGIVKPAASIPRTGKKIAVIGSGPAGLAAAERLNSRGHHVAVIERDDKPGGLLTLRHTEHEARKSRLSTGALIL